MLTDDLEVFRKMVEESRQESTSQHREKWTESLLQTRNGLEGKLKRTSDFKSYAADIEFPKRMRY